MGVYSSLFVDYHLLPGTATMKLKETLIQAHGLSTPPLIMSESHGTLKNTGQVIQAHVLEKINAVIHHHPQVAHECKVVLKADSSAPVTTNHLKRKAAAAPCDGPSLASLHTLLYGVCDLEAHTMQHVFRTASP